MISSMSEMSIFFGMKFAPMPISPCGPALPPESSGEPAGSTATSFTSGFFSLR